MAEYVFKSSLTMEEIENNFKGTDFFGEVMEGLQEALSYENGCATAETLVRQRSLPDVNVVEIRKSLNMTQRGFADILGVSTRTVESWECGKLIPTLMARKLMYLIREDHSIVQKLQ